MRRSLERPGSPGLVSEPANPPSAPPATPFNAGGLHFNSVRQLMMHKCTFATWAQMHLHTCLQPFASRSSLYRVIDRCRCYRHRPRCTGTGRGGLPVGPFSDVGWFFFCVSIRRCILALGAPSSIIGRVMGSTPAAHSKRSRSRARKGVKKRSDRSSSPSLPV